MFFCKLPWDSSFFNSTVARVTIEMSDEVDYKNIQELVEKEQVDLLYIFVDSINWRWVYKLNTVFIKPINTKVIYQAKIDTRHLPLNSDSNKFIKIEVLKSTAISKEAFAEIAELSLQAGSFSRFKLDEKISNEYFERLYQQWVLKIIHSSEGKLYVAKELKSEKIVGFIAGSFSLSQFKIELVAVADEFRNQKIASSLISQVVHDAKLYRVGVIFVETQLENIAACKFYESNDFKKIASLNIYHLYPQNDFLQ
jgi:ribosomal protein S18 acetylase RimI-like enzyme